MSLSIALPPRGSGEIRHASKRIVILLPLTLSLKDSLSKSLRLF